MAIAIDVESGELQTALAPLASNRAVISLVCSRLEVCAAIVAGSRCRNDGWAFVVLVN